MSWNHQIVMVSVVFTHMFLMKSAQQGAQQEEQ